MKYMGSKARFTKDILPIVLAKRKQNQYYVEPFAGGMNMMSEVGGNRIANDIHTPLIEMWKYLVYKGWKPSKYTREEHRHIRENKDKYLPHVVGWVGFNCSYSGVYFGGFSGKTKTKIGTVRDYQQEAINNVSKQIPKLKGVTFTNLNYWDIEIPSNSIIYCDPPYENVSKYKIGTEFDHRLFWNWCRDKSREGHIVYVSEYNAPDDFKCVWEKKTKSSLSANGKSGGSKSSVEKLFRLSM